MKKINLRNFSFELRGCDDKWYRIVFKSADSYPDAEDETGYVVRSPDMQGLVTQGDDILDAIRMAKDALDILIEVRQAADSGASALPLSDLSRENV